MVLPVEAPESKEIATIKVECPICSKLNTVPIMVGEATPAASNLLEAIQQCPSCNKFFTVTYNTHTQSASVY